MSENVYKVKTLKCASVWGQLKAIRNFWNNTHWMFQTANSVAAEFANDFQVNVRFRVRKDCDIRNVIFTTKIMTSLQTAALEFFCTLLVTAFMLQKYLKARLHGSPRLINAVESTKVNRVNSSFQRKWSTGLTGEQVGGGQLSFNVVDSLWVTHYRLPVCVLFLYVWFYFW